MDSPLYAWAFGLLATVIFLLVFYGLVKLMFFVAGTEPGYFHRWRPWLAIGVLWLVFGFAVRVLLGLMTAGMLETPGVYFLASIVAWPYALFCIVVR